MIVLFTDFGLEGPYIGQVRLALWREAPSQPVFDLFADAPSFRPREAAYLLAAYAQAIPAGSVLLCVVDPGVGTGRPAEAAWIDGRWYVGPGNGLFEPLLRRAKASETFHLKPTPQISASFHGRDLFAPVAARLARGDAPDEAGLVPASPCRKPGWPDELAAIVYVDRYGNLMTGLRAALLPAGSRIKVGARIVRPARTFGEVSPGEAFWYENANGLAEIAVNQGHADQVLGVGVGDEVGLGGV